MGAVSSIRAIDYKQIIEKLIPKATIISDILACKSRLKNGIKKYSTFNMLNLFVNT